MSGLEQGPAALVLEPGSPRPWPEIGRILAYHLELHPTDAIARVRYGGGVLCSGLSERQADLLQVQLLRSGVSARRVDASLLADLPRPRSARSLVFSGEEIRVQLTRGGERTVARGGLHGVHLYALSEGRSERSGAEERSGPGARLRAIPGLRALVGRGPAASSEEEKAQVEARWFREHHHDLGEELELTRRGQRLREALLALGKPPPRLFLTLLAGAPAGPLKLRQEDLDYSSLGGEKMPHSLDNFLRLLEDLLAFQPQAWMAERLERFLSTQDPADILYFKPEEGQNLERWMQLWIRILEEEG